MKGQSFILFLFCCFVWSCEEEDVIPDGKSLPTGLSSFSIEELEFLPNPTVDRIYGELPSLVNEMSMLYVEERSEQYVYAWQQYFYKFSENFNLKAEFRFRYLETNEKTFKTLLIGLNYFDHKNKLRKQEFELPISIKDTADSYFSTFMNFYPEVTLGDVEWEDVYELFPTKSTPAIEYGIDNYEKIYYSRHHGIIMIYYYNGEVWLLKP